MYKATLYFSDKDKDTRDAARARIVELGNDVEFTGATITDTLGVWAGATEPGFTYSVLYPVLAILEPRAQQIAARLALEYGQECTLLEISEVGSARLVSVDSTTTGIL